MATVALETVNSSVQESKCSHTLWTDEQTGLSTHTYSVSVYGCDCPCIVHEAFPEGSLPTDRKWCAPLLGWLLPVLKCLPLLPTGCSHTPLTYPSLSLLRCARSCPLEALRAAHFPSFLPDTMNLPSLDSYCSKTKPVYILASLALCCTRLYVYVVLVS